MKFRYPSTDPCEVTVKFISSQAPATKPLFAVDDLVSAIGPDGDEKIGTIVHAYKLDERWRYAVECDGEIEGVFFEFELRARGIDF